MLFVLASGKTSLRICTPELSRASHLYSNSNSKSPKICVVQRKLLPESATDSPISTPSWIVYLALPLCSAQPSRFFPLNKLTQPSCAKTGGAARIAAANMSKNGLDVFTGLMDMDALSGRLVAKQVFFQNAGNRQRRVAEAEKPALTCARQLLK